jgi:hypothetical protein
MKIADKIDQFLKTIGVVVIVVLIIAALLAGNPLLAVGLAIVLSIISVIFKL